MTETIEKIRAGLAENIRAARSHGYTGTDAEYQHTEYDLDAVVDAIGCEPTAAEWRAAGLEYVGSRHVSCACGDPDGPEHDAYCGGMR